MRISKAIGEILAKSRERNPLLFGVCANDAIHGFQEIIERRKDGVLPIELSGLNFFCIEKEISSVVIESGNEFDSKFEQLDQLIQNCCGGPGVIVSFGDLMVLLDDNSVDAVTYVVSRLSRLLQIHQGKLWLIGVVAKYAMYLKFFMRFPSIEKDWDLQLLPITSLKSPAGGFQSPRPQSLTESFVPFGGLFATLISWKSCFSPSIFIFPVPKEKEKQKIGSQSFSRVHLPNSSSYKLTPLSP